MRDPHPANLLGRGLLDAALEARLVARGIVFAEFVPRANGRGSMAAAAYLLLFALLGLFALLALAGGLVAGG